MSDQPFSPPETMESPQPSPEQAQQTGKDVWGFWATIVLSLIIFLFFFVLQLACSFGYIILTHGLEALGDPRRIEELAKNGDMMTIAAFGSMLPGALLVLLFARLRNGPTVREYLNLRGASWKSFLLWNVLLAFFVIAADLLTRFLGIPTMQEFMIKTYSTAGNLFLFYIAIAVAAPLFEELFFRGFLFNGIQKSRLGPWGAVLITSFFWAVIHQQYEPRLYWIGVIFFMGLIIGVARLRTGSLWVSISMHAVNNFASLLETAYYLQKTGG